MDSRMRNVSGGRQQQDRGPRRSNPYDRSSRPSNSRMASSGAWDAPQPEPASPAYPPSSISIKGSGGPYQVTVGNVAKGTSAEDIKLTFEPYGEVLDVVERQPPSLNHPSISFEVFFSRKEDGKAACHALNGCLADGRVLSVSPPASDANPAFASFNGSVSAAARQRVGQTGQIQPGPAPLPRASQPLPPQNHQRELLGSSSNHHSNAQGYSNNGNYGKGGVPAAPAGRAGPTGPAAGRGGSVAVAAGNARGPAGRAAAGPSKPGPAGTTAAAPKAPQPKSLQSRLGMGPSPAEKQRAATIKKQQKALASKGASAVYGAGGPAGAGGGAAAGGKKGNGAAAGPVSKSLKERITIPLAERLAAASSSASDPAKAALNKRKKEAKKAKTAGGKKTKASGMDVD